MARASAISAAHQLRADVPAAELGPHIESLQLARGLVDRLQRDTASRLPIIRGEQQPSGRWRVDPGQGRELVVKTLEGRRVVAVRIQREAQATYSRSIVVTSRTCSGVRTWAISIIGTWSYKKGGERQVDARLRIERPVRTGW